LILQGLSPGIRRFSWWATPPIFFFLWSILAHGTPALRHDWLWPTTPAARLAYGTAYLSGWDPTGFGAPHPNVSMYVLASLIWAGLLLFGGFATLLVLLSVIAGVVLACAYRCARTLGAPIWTSRLLASAALFNPWVYSKVVAGHLAMILAYGLTYRILTDLYTRRGTVMSWLVVLVGILGQLQFFLLDMLVVLGYVRRRRAIRRAVLAVIVIASPVAIGLLGDHAYLHALPYTLNWQDTQSLPSLDVYPLLGYFTAYTRPVDTLFRIAGWAFCGGALMLTATSLSWRLRFGLPCALLLWGALLMGVHGPFAVPYAIVVQRIHESAIFRELYDLSAYLLIGYLAAAALVARTMPRLVTLLFGVGCCASASAWALYPPYEWFVTQERIPIVAVTTSPMYRFAVLPPLQPMIYKHRGTGFDPEITPHDGGVQPLNAYAPSATVIDAFSRYLQHGDGTALAALGVAEVWRRPGFVSQMLLPGERAPRAAFSLPLATPPILLSHPTPLLSWASRTNATISCRRPFPWLVIAVLPPHATAALLRFNESYDAGWRLWERTGYAEHRMIDGVANGWEMSPAQSAQRIVIVHWISLLQAIAELCGFGSLIVMLGRAVFVTLGALQTPSVVLVGSASRSKHRARQRCTLSR